VMRHELAIAERFFLDKPKVLRHDLSGGVRGQLFFR
jgi:hypothetical protein